MFAAFSPAPECSGSPHDYSSAFAAEEAARGRRPAVAILTLAVLVFLSTSSPLRAEEWARSVPARLAHQLIGGSAAQAIRCVPCPHPDPAYGADPIVGFLEFGAGASGLYMYDGSRDRYWLVNLIEVSPDTYPGHLAHFQPAIDRAAGLAQFYQDEPARIERLSWGKLPSTTAYQGVPAWVKRAAPYAVLGLIFLLLLAGAFASEYAANEDDDGAENVEAAAAFDDDDSEDYDEADILIPAAAAIPVEVPTIPVLTPVVMVAPPVPATRFPEPVLTPQEEVDRLMAEELRRLREELGAITYAADTALI